MEKILSVCIPTYNMEELLPRCLNSFVIKEEFMSQMEIIVVNDGSKDKSSIIAHQFKDKYPNTFLVIDKSNGNYGSCINAALKVAKGKYFRICDADDFYITDNLVEYISFLAETDVDLIFSPYITVGANGEIISEQNVSEEYLNKKIEIDDLSWESTDLRRFIAMHSISVKTKVLIDNNYIQTEGISYTDTQYVFYSSLYANDLCFFPKPLYSYMLGRDGQTMSYKSMIRTHMHFMINAEKMLNDFNKIQSITSNRESLLLHPLFSELSSYIGVVLCYIYDSASKLEIFNKLIDNPDNPNFRKQIEPLLLQRKSYYMWKKMHISPKLIYCIMRIRMIFH